MKKTILYSLALLATVGLASCNGDYDDWAAPQSYSQEDAAAKYGITFANGPEANTTLPDADGEVQLVQVNAADSAITGITLKSLTINGQAFNGSVKGMTITVPAADLAKFAYKTNNSRAAKKLDLNVETQVSINLKSGEAVTFDTKGNTTGSITPEATPAVDPNGYFLLGNFKENGDGWDLKTPVWMTANGDGTYSATVNTTTYNGVNYFKIYGGSSWNEADAENSNWDNVNAAQYGAEVNGDVALDNFAVWQGDPVYTGGPQSAGIFSTGKWVVTFDPVNMKYSVKVAPNEYYVINYANRYVKNSKVINGRNLMLYMTGDNVYSLTTKWVGMNDIKIWNADDFGSSAMFFGTTENNSTAESGSLTQTSAGFISAPSAGYYRFTMDMNAMTYKWEAVAEPTTNYTSVTVSGVNAAMKQVRNAPHNWYLKNVTVAAETKVHFAANDGKTWGAASDATVSGSNYSFSGGTTDITVPAGKYSFYLNDIDGTINIVAQ